jgi:hypothetical protein
VLLWRCFYGGAAGGAGQGVQAVNNIFSVSDAGQEVVDILDLNNAGNGLPANMFCQLCATQKCLQLLNVFLSLVEMRHLPIPSKTLLSQARGSQGRPQCIKEECSKPALVDGICITHGARKPQHQCNKEGCNNIAIKKGKTCAGHMHQEMKRSGCIAFTGKKWYTEVEFEIWNKLLEGNTDGMKDNVFQCHGENGDKQQFLKTMLECLVN